MTLKQTPTQQVLKIVDLTYGYTLTCTEVECARSISFDISIDILGDDLVRDDLLAAAVDRHIVECEATHLDPIKMRRNFVVGQSLLDEDVGADEIKLRVWARDSSGGEISAMTGVVRGNF